MKLIFRFYINLHTYWVLRRAVRKAFTPYPIFLCLKGNVNFRKIWDCEHLKSRRPGLATDDEGWRVQPALTILTKHVLGRDMSSLHHSWDLIVLTGKQGGHFLVFMGTVKSTSRNQSTCYLRLCLSCGSDG